MSTTGGASGAEDPGTPPAATWAEVGRQLQDLGRAVRGHLEPESPDAATWSPPPPGEPGADRRDDWRDDRWADARDAVHRLGRSAQQLATQAGQAARDPVVRESARQAVRSLGSAVSRAAEDLGAQLRQNARSPRWSDPTRPRRAPEPPVRPVPPEDEPPPEPGHRR